MIEIGDPVTRRRPMRDILQDAEVTRGVDNGRAATGKDGSEHAYVQRRDRRSRRRVASASSPARMHTEEPRCCSARIRCPETPS